MAASVPAKKEEAKEYDPVYPKATQEQLKNREEKWVRVKIERKRSDHDIKLGDTIDWKEIDKKYIALGRSDPSGSQIDPELLTAFPMWGYYTLKDGNKVCRVFSSAKETDGTITLDCFILQKQGLEKVRVPSTAIERMEQWSTTQQDAIRVHIASWMWYQPVGHYAAFTSGAVDSMQKLYLASKKITTP
jgi:hypothetical protein